MIIFIEQKNQEQWKCILYAHIITLPIIIVKMDVFQIISLVHKIMDGLRVDK